MLKKNYQILCSFVFALAFCSPLHAQTKIVGEEPDSPRSGNLGEVVDSSEMDYRPAFSVYKKSSGDLWDELSIRGAYKSTFENYKMSGKGVSEALSRTRGDAFSGEIHFRPSFSWYKFIVGYSKQSTEMKYEGMIKFYPPNQPFKLRHEEYKVAIQLNPWREFNMAQSFWRRFGFVLGYSIRHRDALVTYPQTLVTSLDQQGLYFGPTYETKFGTDKKWGLDSGIELFLPHKSKETEYNTGFNLSSYTGIAKLNISYSVLKCADIVVGAFFELQQNNYTGTPRFIENRTTRSRMVVNSGHERLTNFGFPVELRVFF